MRVLVADDDVTLRGLLSTVLKNHGYEPVVVADGEHAWRTLQEPDAPRLVILDWNMPKMDGLAVCRRLRQVATSDPFYVILVTARDEKEDIVLGLTSGANDFVTKPFDPNELTARIAVGRKVVELQQSLNERVRELSAALEHVKTLQGIIPICMHCHKIRTDTESWERIDQYIEAHSDAQFTHGLCPECLERHYPIR